MFFLDPGTAPDNLLEGGHGVDRLVEDDELAGLGVHSGGKKLGGGGDDGELGFGVDEVVELGFAFDAIASDTHDVLGVIESQLAGGVGDGYSHTLGVIDVFTEDDGFLEGVGGVEEPHDALGDKHSALVEDEEAVHVLLVVGALLDVLS